MSANENVLNRVQKELAAEYRKEPAAISLAARDAAESAYAKAYSACEYVAYGLKPGDAQGLARAQQLGKRRGLVLIRMKNDGSLTVTGVDLAATAIASGWATLEV